MREFKVLHLFTQTGKTFTFFDGTIVTNNEAAMVIKYKAVSNGLEKVGVFFWTNLIGYSLA